MVTRQLISLVLISTFSLEAKCISCKEQNLNPYIRDRILQQDKRYGTFAYALELMEERGAYILVETGTSRGGDRNCEGDGCSTLIFADYVKQNGGSFYSVDIDPNAIKNAEDALEKNKKYVHLVTRDSIAFLENFGQTIDFLYLDSFDYAYDNPTLSQEHHLKEIQAAYPYLTRDSIIMIDDHALPNGGKSKLVMEFLLAKGWNILAEGYQVILTQR